MNNDNKSLIPRSYRGKAADRGRTIAGLNTRFKALAPLTIAAILIAIERKPKKAKETATT